MAAEKNGSYGYRKGSLDHRQDAPPGSPAAKILETVQRELAEAGSSSSAKRQVLRRLVRRLHPDQNRGKETGADWGWLGMGVAGLGKGGMPSLLDKKQTWVCLKMGYTPNEIAI